MLLHDLLPLPVVVPLMAGATLSALTPLLRGRRRLLDGLAIAVAAATTAMLVALAVGAGRGELVYWFGGWHPVGGVALGIDFATDPLGAGLAAVAAGLTTTALVWSWRWFDEPGTWFPVLMLLFLAGMDGFCLTGDLFDLFVWFEVLGTASYALTAVHAEGRGPLAGALTFAITNSVGGYLSLSGIGLLYGRVDTLDLAQIGRTLARHRPDDLVIVAFVLVSVGLLVKAAVVPFHLWLADAHAVAPTPVCVLLSGVMVELGVYAVARVWWTAFAGHLGTAAVGPTLIGLGAATSVVGAGFCWRQRHLKRLLAFSTVSQVGATLMGVGLLDPSGLAGASGLVLGHAAAKSALFLSAGVVLDRTGTLDVGVGRGRARSLRLTAVVWTLAGLALAGAPPFAGYLGTGWIEADAVHRGLWWVAVIAGVGEVTCAAAVLRSGAAVFLGVGPDVGPLPAGGTPEGSDDGDEVEGRRDSTPRSMLVPPLVLVALDAGLGVAPGLAHALGVAAGRFEDQARYAAAVLGGPLPAAPHVALPSTAATLLAGSASALAALAAAALACARPTRRQGGRVVAVMRAAQSGLVADYVTWVVVGTAVVGAALVASAR